MTSVNPIPVPVEPDYKSKFWLEAYHDRLEAFNALWTVKYPIPTGGLDDPEYRDCFQRWCDDQDSQRERKTSGGRPRSRCASQIKNLADIRRAAYPAPHPIVHGLFAEGETILLIGRPKIGKSRLTQQLTLCMSRGEAFLGHRIDRPHRVLYLDLENRLSGVQSRFRVMSPPHECDKNIFVYAPQTLAENAFVASTDGIGELDRVVDEFLPDVLIIDPWRLFVGGDGNKEDVVMNGLKVLSKIRQNHPDLAIILVHHLRKQSEAYGKGATLRLDPSAWVEGASGHYALIGHSDATLGLERERTEGDELIVFGGIARTLTPPLLILDESDETLLFDVARGVDVLQHVLTPAEQKIWNAACTKWNTGARGAAWHVSGTFTFGELMTAAGTKNRKAVTRTLRKVEEAGMITHDGRAYSFTPDAMPCFGEKGYVEVEVDDPGTP